jgi:predicted esterase
MTLSFSKTILAVALLTAALPGGRAADPLASLPAPVLLWPEGAPKAVDTQDEDKPAVMAFLPDPDKATGAAILVCPGGGFMTRCVDWEGVQVAQWLKARGIAGFVLRYRIRPMYTTAESLMDAQRAMQYLRMHAADYKIATNRIGIIGFSAGAELASMVTVSAVAAKPESKDAVDHFGSRPDFTVLAYGSSRVPDSADAAAVKAMWPPTFFFCTQEDMGHLTGMLSLYSTLTKARVPCEAHFFQSGEHGVSVAEGDPTLGVWPGMMFNWVQNQGFLTEEKKISVTGVIQVDGEPLAHGYVIFTPINIKGASTVVAHVFNTGPVRGQYKISPDQGLFPGKYNVEVRQEGTRWMSNSRDPVFVRMQQKRGNLTEEERKEWITYARKRDLSPSIEGLRVYSKARPGDKEEMTVEVKAGMTAHDITVVSK